MPLARSRAMARDGAWYQALARALNSGHRSVGSLTARLRIRCARQRCRAERGKHSAIARMIPMRLGEEGFLQMRLEEVGSFQMRLDEQGSFQMRLGEARFPQIGQAPLTL